MNQNIFLPEQILIPFFGDVPIVGAEIGIQGASGSYSMLFRMPKLKLYCIDPWKHFTGHLFEAEEPQEYHENNYRESLKRLQSYIDEGRCIVLRMTSDEALEVIQEPLDFVWIDGDHRYIQQKKDMHFWKGKIKKRAILGGHDWHLDDTKKAVEEEIGNVELGDDWSWWKKYEE